MKKKLLAGAAGTFAMLFVTGCQVTAPAPVADVNADALREPIAYYGDIELFDEKSTPLLVMVRTPFASGEIFLAETLKNALNKSDVNCVAAGKPFDIQIYINSGYNELTPVPQCRLEHILSISVAAADGTGLLPVWEHKTETGRAYPSTADAQKQLKPLIIESIKNWEKNNFSNEAGKVLKASVVRFRMSRKLVEVNPVSFEKDLRTVLNKLRKIDGVVAVRMIEADKDSRIASFRVLHRNDLSIKNEIQKQK